MKNVKKTIAVLLAALLLTGHIANSQINLRGKKDIKINKNKTSEKNNAGTKTDNTGDKTMAGVKLESAAAYYYKSYSKYMNEANEHVVNEDWSSALSSTESARIAIKKVQQKSEDELDLSLEIAEIDKVEGIAKDGNSQITEGYQNERNERNSAIQEKENQKKEMEAKYYDLMSNTRKIVFFLEYSSSTNFNGLKEGLEFFEEKGLSMADIRKMLDDPEENEKAKEYGSYSSRAQLKDELIPSINNALNKEEGDYNLDGLDDKLDEMGELYAKAKSGGLYAFESLKKIEDFYNIMGQFKNYTNNHSSVESYYLKAKNYYTNSKKDYDELAEKYRAGGFHRTEGSGIYIVQKDGITPQTLSKNDVTEKIIIDGKSPVHIFILTDFALSEYSTHDGGSYLQFDFVDGGKGPNQNKYIVGAKRAIPLFDEDRKIGYKKLVLIPSADWNDLDQTYVKSFFYDCGIQKKLAETLSPGEEKKFTIYSANNQLKKEFTIEATTQGIEFLKSMPTKMEKYEIDAERMKKGVYQDANLVSKISSGFIKNSNGVVSEVIRVVITSKPWYVEKDVYGDVIYKQFYGQVAFKKTDGNYYIQQVDCRKKMAGGKLQPMIVYGLGPSRRIRKENINK